MSVRKKVRIRPSETMFYEGRLVTELVCHESKEDRKKRVANMLRESNHNRKPVVRFNADGTNPVIYSSMSEAGKALDICPSQISKATRSGATAGEFKWKKQSNLKTLL